MTELDFEYLRDVLDNITYWETCPDKDKQRLRLLVKQIDEHRKQVKNLNIDDVSVSFLDKTKTHKKVIGDCDDCVLANWNKSGKCKHKFETEECEEIEYIYTNER